MNIKLHQNGYGIGSAGIGDNLLMNALGAIYIRLMSWLSYLY